MQRNEQLHFNNSADASAGMLTTFVFDGVDLSPLQ